ncbi:MAG: cardiolipin synthase [Gemmatimonadaceae bacterium]|nr:cardiolipin synthase [Gemmatimonadaceae bacterium]
MIFRALPGWLIAVEVVWVVAMSGYILLERRPPLATLAWIIGLAYLPVLGFVVYYFLGPRRLSRKRRRRVMARTAKRARAGGAAPNRNSTGQELGNSGARLAAVAAGTEQAPPLPATEVQLYDLGSHAYNAIIESIGTATHHVHLEYYILNDGVVAKRIRAALIERAKAGVQVRLLLDGLGTSRLGAYLQPLRDAGVEIARFGPRMRPGFVNFRTHRKMVICDGTTGFTGGMNIDDCHDESVVGVAQGWRDTQVKLVGDAVAPLALAFLEDWQYATGTVLDGIEFLPPLTGTGDKLVQVCASGPDAHPQSIHAVFFTAIATARERVWISTPYFVPDDSLQEALIAAALRGVDVRVLVPGTSDQPFVDAASRSYFPEFLSAGVLIHAYGPPALHSKTMVVDRDAAIVGTANVDNRSLRLNFEVLAICYGSGFADELARMFEQDLTKSRAITAETIAHRSIGARLFEGGARLFSPML